MKKSAYFQGVFTQQAATSQSSKRNKNWVTGARDVPETKYSENMSNFFTYSYSNPNLV